MDGFNAFPGGLVDRGLPHSKSRRFVSASAHYAEKIQNRDNQHDRPNNSQATTGAPSGVSVITTAASKQQQKDQK